MYQDTYTTGMAGKDGIGESGIGFFAHIITAATGCHTGIEHGVRDLGLGNPIGIDVDWVLGISVQTSRLESDSAEPIRNSPAGT